jgi:hypothetical protein
MLSPHQTSHIAYTNNYGDYWHDSCDQSGLEERAGEVTEREDWQPWDSWWDALRVAQEELEGLAALGLLVGCLACRTGRAGG